MTNSSSFSAHFCQTPAVDLAIFPASPSPTPYTPPFLYTGNIRGFSSCTESLGFESSDDTIITTTGEGTFMEGPRDSDTGPGCSTPWARAMRRSQERRRVVEFPPPLTSIDERGRRGFVLRPLRRDGRLELTEVSITHPKILHATRENGRLTLRLIVDSDDHDEAGDQGEEEEEVLIEGDGEEIKVGSGDDVKGGEWLAPAPGGEAAPRRCYEYDMAGNRYLSVWSPRCCVTTM